jgi:hypothetical protein
MRTIAGSTLKGPVLLVRRQCALCYREQRASTAVWERYDLRQQHLRHTSSLEAVQLAGHFEGHSTRRGPAEIAGVHTVSGFHVI